MRTLVTIVVNLYTVRLLWEVLGIDNYGIYNLVGGIVFMFAFLNNAMVASSQRFISFELGTGNKERLKKTFSISVLVHLLLAICVLILAETVGLWFLNEKLNIPEGRMEAANWVYQCSIVSFLVTIISVPYNSCIVAHEHMKTYGYLGIIDVILKLLIVLLVAIIPFDRLIAYSILLPIISFCNWIIYNYYCRKHFEECHFIRTKDNHLMKDMFSFAGWSFLGNMGFSVRDQGINILLNLFFNVAVNAAKGVANQVGNTVNNFVLSFTMAMNPQITKRYASGDLSGVFQLIYKGCKFSLILISIVIIPLIICAEEILKLWLGNVAPYTVGFLQLTLLMLLVDCVVSPITTTLQATGKIKKFQILISIIMVSIIPLSWLWLKFDANPYVVMFLCISASIIALITRLLLLKEQIAISLRKFFINVYIRTIPYIFISVCLSWFLYHVFNHDLFGLICFVVSSLIITISLIFLIALNNKERRLVLSFIQQKINIIIK